MASRVVGKGGKYMDISTATDEQLKALAYDEMVKIEVAQKNLQVINTELTRRAQQGQQEED
jgi:hypothetical protein